MPTKVTLTINKGSASGKAFAYTEKESLIVGRQDDCAIVLPENTVSRYHCMIDIAPPAILVRDFGSLNGTYLNGEIIGKRAADMPIEDARKADSNTFPLKAGDRLGLGRDCELTVSIAIPQFCADCFCEIEDSAYTNSDGLAICESCHTQALAYAKKEKDAKLAAQKAERERKESERKAAELAAKEKAAADEKAREKAAQERAEAEKRAAALKEKQKAEEEKQRKAEAERKAAEERVAADKQKHNDRRCEVCGAKLTGGTNEPNICLDCRRNPLKVLQFLMQQAAKGQPGTQEIAGYRRIRSLGKGGMGEVWLVEEEKTGRQMALKIMLPQAAAHEKSREMFLREGSLAGQLEHQNIARQYYFGSVGKSYFILLEYCDGGSVDKLMEESGGRLGLELATEIMLQALDGLAYTHSARIAAKLQTGETRTVEGIVHRDFKPANIFLTGSKAHPTAKVADFGLAKAFEIAGLSGVSTPDQISGTVPFVPRQQIINCRYAKPPVDVWAAAASYYQMLTGVFPRDLRGKDMVAAVLNNPPVPIRKRDARIPVRLAEAIDTALIEKPDIKIQSALEFKKMIEDALS